MDIAVLINANARRGSGEALRLIQERLPEARLKVTHTGTEAREWLRKELKRSPPELLLGGGGDGTMVGLLNDLRELGVPFPVLGALPLGTGNAWAHVTGAHRVRECVECLGRLDGQAVPARTFGLLEIEGKLAHFGGTGWEAEIINDYQQVLKQGGPLRKLQKGLAGYLLATFTRTVPRHLVQRKRPQVRVVNTGEPALGVDAQGNLRDIPGGGSGEVLYEGPMGVASASTTPEWGYGFKAFPFAGVAPGRASMRVYAGTVVDATLHARGLWRGDHPMPKMHDFLLTQGRMEFDRPMPCQLGGDLLGDREALDFQVADERVQLLEWHALTARS